MNLKHLINIKEFHQLKSLKKSDLIALLPLLLADDSDRQLEKELKIRFNDYVPCSFTVEERFENKVPLDENESVFSAWLSNLIDEYIKRIPNSHHSDRKSFRNFRNEAIQNFYFLMNYELNANKIGSTLWNQEAPDIVNNVCLFTLKGDLGHNICTHDQFNRLAFEIIPKCIEYLQLTSLHDEKKLLEYAISSGLCGLDLKGATAAASEFAQPGILMEPLFGDERNSNKIDEFCHKLLEGTNRTTPVFHFNEFIHDISKRNILLTWFTDDVIESFFDLLFIKELLKKNDKLEILIIPKNGSYANDLSWEQLEAMLELPIYNELYKYIPHRLSWSRYGPRMGTVNLKKLSPQVKSLLNRTDLAVIKGCRAHEMTQGGFPCPSYTAYIVARSFSEIVSGFDASVAPMLFLRLPEGGYAFYGYNIRKQNPLITKDKRKVYTILSTTYDHIKRRLMMQGKALVDELTEVIKQISKLKQGERIAAIKEANMLAEKLIEITKNTYDKVGDLYEALRWEEPHELDKKLWLKMLSYADKQRDKGLLICNDNKYSLLDMGTGNGRDLKYSQNELGLKSVGIDNSKTFVEKVKKLEKDGKLGKGSIIEGDIRDLSMFEETSFDIIRHNASLLHMPITGKGYMADKAIEECFRVLKKGGILYIFVKYGEGLDILDTGEGLGGRFFQFYNESNLRELLMRNGFTVLEINKEIEHRGDNQIPWLAAYATKN